MREFNVIIYRAAYLQTNLRGGIENKYGLILKLSYKPSWLGRTSSSKLAL